MPGIAGVSVTKLSIVGKIRGVQDWSTGLWMVTTPIPIPYTQAGLDSLAAGLVSPISAWWTTIKGRNNAVVDYRGFNLYYYGPGSTRADLISAKPLTAVPGSGAGGTMPPFTSLVTSLRSVTPGRSGRGRSYAPFTGVALNTTTLEANTADVDAINSAYQTLIAGINALTPASYNLSSIKVVVASSTKGQVFNVATVVTDSKVDTQHRREDVLDPGYVKTAAIP